MIRTADSVKRYASAGERFFKPAIVNFPARECPKLFGPVMREKFAEELIKLFLSVAPEVRRLEPGQMLWNVLHVRTRGDSPRRRYVPVILTVISEGDVERLAAGERMSVVAEGALARMFSEAFEQGGALSSRDVGLLRLRDPSWVSGVRLRYERRRGRPLPHTGSLHDMGSAVSHKSIIIRKVILEKKDPADAARECRHSQSAVDHYLKDYFRVRTLYELDEDIEFIHLATQLARHVIVQYIEIIKQQKNKLTRQMA